MNASPATGREPWPQVDPLRRRIMAANRRRDTSPELLLRSALHRSGLRFRVDYPIRLEGRRPTRPDVVFRGGRVAVFVDGCFWHGCPEHGSAPKRNADYWKAKIERNRQRDREVDRLLRAEGWTVVRIWEHEDVEAAVGSIRALIVDPVRRPARPRG